MNSDHDLYMIVFSYCISKYLLTLSREEALRVISVGYSAAALESLYHTAMNQEGYEVCSIVISILSG